MNAQIMARDLLEKLGMQTSMDSVGNLVGVREGTDSQLAPVAVGSHLDTVPEGGNFDGVLGVASAIEVMRAFDDDRVNTKRSLQVICFACEEGSRFGVGCIGSKFMVGELSPDDAEKIRDLNGLTLPQCITKIGLPGRPVTVRGKGDFSAYVELHIEQGPVLETLGKTIGIVTGIAAPTRLLVQVKGMTGHVGTVPMKTRKDALVAAADIITGVESIVRRTDDNGVGTVSRTDMKPNTVTAIPGSVNLWIDLRYLNENGRTACIAEIKRLVADVVSKRQLEIDLTVLTNERATSLSPRVIETITQATNALGYASIEMASGAMHDAAHMARITDVGMIFVPCKDGVSHAPEESADPRRFEDGVNVLYKTLMALAA